MPTGSRHVSPSSPGVDEVRAVRRVVGVPADELSRDDHPGTHRAVRHRRGRDVVSTRFKMARLGSDIPDRQVELDGVRYWTQPIKEIQSKGSGEMQIVFEG